MTQALLPQRILAYLRGVQPEMVELLKALVLAESPSEDPQSQQPIQDLLAAACDDRGFRVRRLPGALTGGQLLGVPRIKTRGQPFQLLLGHCDTVWPLGTLREMPYRMEAGKVHGPGIYDMKAGLVQALFAVESLQALGITPDVAPVLFVNSDEEIGSPESAAHIQRLAKRADRAFVMEPALGPSGKLKTARKGVGRFCVRVLGKASHAGLAPEQGISAILELSHVVQALFALNDSDKGITVNVGTIDGGLRPNVVAPEARAEADVRVATHDDARRIEAAIYNLKPSVPGTQLVVTGHIGRPPMEPTPGNQRLWNQSREIAGQLGIELDQGMAGGGSDGNWTSLHTPTLDGLGAVGDGAHAITEHVEVDRMPERAALLAALIARPREQVRPR